VVTGPRKSSGYVNGQLSDSDWEADDVLSEPCPIKTAISHLKTSAYQNVAEICGSSKNVEEKMQPYG